MAGTGATNRAGLTQEFNTKVDTNNVKGITSQDVRDTLNSLKDSNLNLTDDDAKDLTYNPITITDWQGTGPTNTGDALDELVKNNETLSFYANTDDSVSNIIVLVGEGLLIDTSEYFNATNVSSVTYETSLDNLTWALAPGSGATQGTFAALKEDVDIMTTNLYIRAVFVFQSGYNGEELVTLKYKKV